MNTCTIDCGAACTTGCSGLTGSDFYTSFEESEDVTIWSVIDADQGGTTWLIFEDPAYAHTGDKYIGSQSNPDGSQSEDWIITPMLQPSGCSRFRFWAAPVDPENSEESFHVLFSVNGIDFYSLFNYQFAAGDTNWQEFSVDLSTVQNQDIYCAIICNSVNQDMLRVDDITITNVLAVYKSRKPAINAISNIQFIKKQS